MDPLAGKEVAACCWKGKYLFDHRHSQELVQFKVVLIELDCSASIQNDRRVPGYPKDTHPPMSMLTSLASCLPTSDIRKVSELDGELETVGGLSRDEDTRPTETEDMALSLVEILSSFFIVLAEVFET